MEQHFTIGLNRSNLMEEFSKSFVLACALLMSLVISNSPAAEVSSISLVNSFPNQATYVTNAAGQALPKVVFTNYSLGGGFVNSSAGFFQNGSTFSANSLTILPPANRADFIKVLFSNVSQPKLSTTYQWVLQGTYGIFYQPGNVSQGVRVQIVVAGDQIDSTDTKWSVIDDFYVYASTPPFLRTTQLGMWPLRNNFIVAIQISAVGNNNFGDNLVIDQPVLIKTVQRPQLGVAQSNLIWDSNPRPIVNSIASLESSWIRTNMSSSSDSTISQFVNVVSAANQAGMKVLSVVIQEEEDYSQPASSYGNAGSDFEVLCGWRQGALRFSDIDISKFKQRFEKYLRNLRDAGAHVDAFEIGNELDWVCFNGDILLGQSGIKASSMTAFLEKYGKILQEAKELLNIYFPSSQLLTFGAANPSLFKDKSFVSDPENLLKNLGNINGKNYLSYVDGYALHFYPPKDNVVATRDILTKYGAALGMSKPFWVTEFGFYEIHDDVLYTAFRKFVELMNSIGPISIGNIFLYTYTSDPSFSLIHKDGKLDSASKILEQYSNLDAGKIPVDSLISMDINGDHKVDFVQTWNNNGKLFLLPYLSAGTGFTAQSWINTNQGFPSQPYGSLLAMDVNGDGKADLVQTWNNNGKLFLLPYLFTGTGFTAQSWINTNQGFPSQPYGNLLTIDVNGDGKADLVQAWNNNGYLYLLTYLSTGTGFTAQSWINTNQNFPSEPNGSLLTMDVNGDCKKDLVQIWNNKGILYLLSYFPSGKNLAPQGAEINTRISFPQRGLENFSGYQVY